jgi:regulator of protease activity HflC (stomatin/prohibitin superfamily)
MDRNVITDNSSNSTLFFRLSLVVTLLSIIFSVICLYFGCINEWFASSTFAIAVVPSLITSLYAFFTLVLAFLKNKSAFEEEDQILLEKRKKSAKTFDGDEDVLFTARRTLANYGKYSEYLAAALGLFLIVVSLVLLNRSWGALGSVEVLPAQQAAFVALVMSVLAILSGVFCIGQSRSSLFRWLRPVGVWFVLNAITMLTASLAITLKSNGVTTFDYIASRVYFAIFAILAVELLINFVIEFYRPRTRLEGKPIFESRILSVITEPGGLLRNIADTLDYQFGFQVSGTWIYRFLERSIAPLLLVWLGLLWLATAFDEVPAGEMGVMEIFGNRSTQTLEPGFHMKWPWPIASIRKFPVNRVQEIFVGSQLKTSEKGKHASVILWTQSHYAKEVIFLIASDLAPSAKLKTDSGSGVSVVGADKTRRATPNIQDEAPVSFITALVPVQFRIRRDELMNFAYGYENPVETLKFISEKVVTEYFASTDMLSVMSDKRSRAIEYITRDIQKKADAIKLGVEIVAVSLLDAHPPIKEELPQAFQDVVAARERKEAMILDAKKYKASTLPAAEADAIDLVSQAEAYKDDRIKVSKAESERFLKRLKGYNAMPEMYVLNEKMRFLMRDCVSLRKYVVPNSTNSDVFVINLEDKRRLDLLDIGDLQEKKPINVDNPNK